MLLFEFYILCWIQTSFIFYQPLLQKQPPKDIHFFVTKKSSFLPVQLPLRKCQNCNLNCNITMILVPVITKEWLNNIVIRLSDFSDGFPNNATEETGEMEQQVAGDLPGDPKGKWWWSNGGKIVLHINVNTLTLYLPFK